MVPWIWFTIAVSFESENIAGVICAPAVMFVAVASDVFSELTDVKAPGTTSFVATWRVANALPVTRVLTGVPATMSPFETTTVVVLMLLSAWLLTLLVYMTTSPAATRARTSAITMLRTL